MQRDHIERRVMQIVSEQLGLPQSEMTLDRKFVELGADSLDDIEIVMGVENEFAVEIPGEDAEACSTVKDACDLVERLLRVQA